MTSLWESHVFVQNVISFYIIRCFMFYVIYIFNHVYVGIYIYVCVCVCLRIVYLIYTFISHARKRHKISSGFGST